MELHTCVYVSAEATTYVLRDSVPMEWHSQSGACVSIAVCAHQHKFGMSLLLHFDGVA